MHMGVNNLPTVVTTYTAAGDQTRDLWIASPTLFRCATTFITGKKMRHAEYLMCLQVYVIPWTE